MEEYKYTIKDLAKEHPKYTETYIGSLISIYVDRFNRKKIKGLGKAFCKTYWYTIDAFDILKEIINTPKKLANKNANYKAKQEARTIVKSITDLSHCTKFNDVVKDIPQILEVSRSGLNQYVFNFVESFKVGKSGLYIANKDIERAQRLAQHYIDENIEYVPNLFSVYEIRKTKDGKLVLIHKPTPGSKLEPIITNPTHEELIKTMKNLN